MVCEVWADRWVEGEGKGEVKGLSSRVEKVTKQGGSIGAVTYEAKKKGKICFVIYIAGKRFFLFMM